MRVGRLLHRWEVQSYVRTARGRLFVVVLCPFCHTLAAAAPGSSPTRIPPCDGVRPIVPIVWAAPRADPGARYFWALRR